MLRRPQPLQLRGKESVEQGWELAGRQSPRGTEEARPGQSCRLRELEPVLSNHWQGGSPDEVGTGRQAGRQTGWRGRAAAGGTCSGGGEAARTWLICTAGMEAADTAEWLGELGSDLQGPMASCCFFRKATTFWATAGDSTVNHPWGEKRGARLRAATPRPLPPPPRLPDPLWGSVPGAVTVLEDALHVESVGGARLVVGAALQVCGQLAGPAVVDDPRVRGTDGVCWRRESGD